MYVYIGYFWPGAVFGILLKSSLSATAYMEIFNKRVISKIM